jgi:hypothetical protein
MYHPDEAHLGWYGIGQRWRSPTRMHTQLENHLPSATERFTAFDWRPGLKSHRKIRKSVSNQISLFLSDWLTLNTVHVNFRLQRTMHRWNAFCIARERLFYHTRHLPLRLSRHPPAHAMGLRRPMRGTPKRRAVGRSHQSHVLIPRGRPPPDGPVVVTSSPSEVVCRWKVSPESCARPWGHSPSEGPTDFLSEPHACPSRPPATRRSHWFPIRVARQSTPRPPTTMAARWCCRLEPCTHQGRVLVRPPCSEQWADCPLRMQYIVGDCLAKILLFLWDKV